MSALQCVLTVIAWLAGLGAVPFVYVILLANAMKTTAGSHSVSVHSLGEVGSAVDLARHSRVVLQELKQRLDNGWRPGADGQDTVEIQIPAAGA